MPFESLGVVSYLPSIVTMVLSRIVCEILKEFLLIGRKSQNSYTPPVFSASTGGDHVGILWRCLMLVKLEWLGYRMVKKLWRYVKPFSSDTGTLQMDRRTDLLCQYRVSVCWRAIKIEQNSCIIVKFNAIYFRQNSETSDILHAFLSSVIAKLSDCKNSPFFRPTLYMARAGIKTRCYV